MNPLGEWGGGLKSPNFDVQPTQTFVKLSVKISQIGQQLAENRRPAVRYFTKIWYWRFSRLKIFFSCTYLSYTNLLLRVNSLIHEPGHRWQQCCDIKKSYTGEYIFQFLLHHDSRVAGADIFNSFKMSLPPRPTVLLPSGQNLKKEKHHDRVYTIQCKNNTLGRIDKELCDVKFGIYFCLSNITIENKNIMTGFILFNAKITLPKFEKEKHHGRGIICSTIRCLILSQKRKNYEGRTTDRGPLKESKQYNNKFLYGSIQIIFNTFLESLISELALLIDMKDIIYKSKNLNCVIRVSKLLLLTKTTWVEKKIIDDISFLLIILHHLNTIGNFLRFKNKPIKLCIKNTTWWSQPFTRGSYTAIGVGASQSDIANIAHPIYMDPTSNKPAIVFGGEHCHPSFYSTVHGAYLSGRDAAALLCVPDTPPEQVLDVEGTADLSSWIQGISLTC
ncbi:unnamed protein product, partial [Meganyctiphanes norvegica]